MTWGAEKLTVNLGAKPALSGIDLRLEQGSVTAVVGGDGAGKTTLCRVLVGLVRPSSGSLRVPGRLRIGYQPAGSGTWGDLTVRENLQFVADAHHLTKASSTDRIARLLASTALDVAIDRLATHLSGGMRRKLGVAMALLGRPDLLVLDEPTTGIDPVSRSELWQLITRSATDGAVVVMTTTYLDEAERAERILALDEGAPLGYGSLAELIAALPGRVWASAVKPVEPHRWRRGAGWRIWTADGHQPDQALPIEPDLNDLLTSATIARQAT